MIDKVDINGATALMAAVENAHFQAHTVKILLINGADISIRNNSSETAYDLIQSRVDDTTKYLKYALASRLYFVRFHHMGEMKRHEYKDTGDTGYDYDEFDRI